MWTMVFNKEEDFKPYSVHGGMNQDRITDEPTSYPCIAFVFQEHHTSMSNTYYYRAVFIYREEGRWDVFELINDIRDTKWCERVGIK